MIDEFLIKATAARYSEAELVALRDAALDELERGSMVTAASSAGGGSYTRQEQLPPKDRVVLYNRALEYKQTGSLDEGVCESFNIKTFGT